MKQLLVIAFFVIALVEIAFCQTNNTRNTSNTNNGTAEKCFKFDVKSWKNSIKDKLEKRFKPLIDVCKAEKPNATSRDVRKCCWQKMKNTWTECKTGNWTSRKLCVRQKLHIGGSNSTNMTKVEIKNKFMSFLVNEKKKDAINTAIESCNDQEGSNYWLCCMEKIAKGPCPEVKSLVDRVVAFREKVQKWRKKNRNNGKDNNDKENGKGGKDDKKENNGKEEEEFEN